MNKKAQIEAGRSAFTLVELLVVVSIITILASLLLPALSQARDRAKEIACANTKKQLALAVVLYAGDYSEWVPASTYYTGTPAWRYLAQPLGYLPSTNSFFGAVCASSNVKPASIVSGITIGYNYCLSSKYGVPIRYKVGSFRHPQEIGLWACTKGPPSLWGGSDGEWAWYDQNHFGYRHAQRTNASFLDGHARSFTQLEITTLPNWFLRPWLDS